MLKKRTFQILVVIALIGIALASTISAINPTFTSRADLSWPPRPSFQHLREKNVAPPSYRSQFGECFDVSLRELAECRNTSQAFTLIPVTGGQVATDLSDYYQRHAETSSAGIDDKASDYFLRHTELRSGIAAVDTSDYHLRH
jgi:hypothetical protein